MYKKFIHAVHLESPGDELIAATRERLGGVLPRASARRMTQLGMAMTSVLSSLSFDENVPVVYASQYGESHALEEYLASFPTPSPTLFQTSIHPSAVQQALIARQQPVREFWPHTGAEFLVGRALRTALLTPGDRCVFCGGEERGTWLQEHQVASSETFAFALDLRVTPSAAVGDIVLLEGETGAGRAGLSLSDFFFALRERRALQSQVAPALRLELTWH